MNTDTMLSITIGNEWSAETTVLENGVAKDCTGMEALLIIREELDATSTRLLELDVVWTTQASGIGTYTATPEETADLTEGTYYWEALLYKTDESYNKTYAKGKVEILASLRPAPWDSE